MVIRHLSKYTHVCPILFINARDHFEVRLQEIGLLQILVEPVQGLEVGSIV